MEFKRSSTSQQGTASEQGDPEADRQLREGLVWEARADGLVQAGPEPAVRCRASGRGSSLGLWLGGQLPLPPRSLALLLLLAVQLLQLPLHVLRHLHLQQVFHAMLRLIPNKHLPAGRQVSRAAGWHIMDAPATHPAPAKLCTHLDEFLTSHPHMGLWLPTVQLTQDQVGSLVPHLLPTRCRGCQLGRGRG